MAKGRPNKGTGTTGPKKPVIKKLVSKNLVGVKKTLMKLHLIRYVSIAVRKVYSHIGVIYVR